MCYFTPVSELVGQLPSTNIITIGIYGYICLTLGVLIQETGFKSNIMIPN